eukprot:GFYU01001340.1.p1 GENE.GFYU01001340.1~~GFYU01001340.1.p1  ORF type:complete len:589 (+),score=243.30 GFYU01001340.1:158-1924(+)
MGNRKKAEKEAKAKKAAAKAGVDLTKGKATDAKTLEEKIAEAKNPRTATGSLGSQPLSRDVKIIGFSLSYYGRVLIEDTELELNHGRRYGLLGANGAGKTQLLTAIARKEIPIPEHFDIFHLDREYAATDETALEAVASVNDEKTRLEDELEKIIEEDPESPLLDEIYERLDDLDADKIEAKAGQILHGLGFDKKMQAKQCKDFSGGWRMRISLARALLVQPSIMLLDEPTNHLDLEACVWLEEFLKDYAKILVIISHSQDFMNNVCTNIMHLHRKKLIYYGGNYDTYVQTRAELEEQQMKRYNWEQDQIKHMKEYIARFGHGSAKLARQAQSKEKTLAKMTREGLTERVSMDSSITLRFPDCGKLPPPVLQFVDVDFGYNGGVNGHIYKKIDFGCDLDSRVALVGPNGAGKSTLLKLMVGDLMPTDGMVRRHTQLRIAYFHQHLTDQLDPSLSPIQFMEKNFPDEHDNIEHWRRSVGRFGLTGDQQLVPISSLSDGQKRRVVFAWLSYKTPHMLLLDEPTNHLDMETIDALAEGINAFEGGLVLVSHDFRLINQVAKEIWICENQGITRFDGDIQSYKNVLRQKMGL